MRRVAIIQARTNSTRLPGKVLVDIEGKPMLVRVIERLRRCHNLDNIVVAAPARDGAIRELAEAENVPFVGGSEHDVLSRYVDAATEFCVNSGVIVRVTADCPLIDPEVVDDVIGALARAHNDYASNTIRRTYPRGLDVEAFYLDTLLRLNRLALSLPAREHVTYYLHHEHPELFLHHQLFAEIDNSDLHWTVDTAADLDHVRQIYRVANLAQRHLPYRELLTIVRTQMLGMNIRWPTSL